MGFFDKLTGTRHPSAGVVPRPAEELRAALLGLGRPDVPYTVRDGTPDGADLLAEWRLTEPAWQSHFLPARMSRTLKIKMRLVPARHEVRALDEQWKVTWVGDTPRLATSREYSRGQMTERSWEWTIERGADGRLHKTETFHFNTAELKDPLRKTVVGAGWTWRGVTFGKL